jgi:hypothetical protein
MKLIHHNWVKQPGFKTDKCSICKCIRKYHYSDYKYSSYIYELTNGHIQHHAPECKSTFLNDKI